MRQTVRWRVGLGLRLRAAAALILAATGLRAFGQPGGGVAPLSPSGVTQPDSQPHLAQPRITPALAADAWDDQRWADAANYYRALCRQHTEDPLFHFRLAYALHADGQFRRAVAAHQRAAEFEEYRAVSLYNLGCAHSALGNTDRAFDALAAAVEAGYDDPEQMASDADLLPLHDDPRWAAMLRGDHPPPDQPTPRPGDPRDPPGWGDVPREVEFLLGEWEVLDERGRRVGTASVHPDHDGQVLVHRWRSDDGTTGTALLFYDGVVGAWRRVAIDSDGVAVEMAGEVFRSEMELEGEMHTPRGDRILQRLVVGERRDGNLGLTTRESEDEGRSWRTVWTSTWRPLGIVPPVHPEPGKPGGGSGGWKPGLAGDKAARGGSATGEDGPARRGMSTRSRSGSDWRP